jgi:hypothetical protein
MRQNLYETTLDVQQAKNNNNIEIIRKLLLLLFIIIKLKIKLMEAISHLIHISSFFRSYKELFVRWTYLREKSLNRGHAVLRNM